MRYLSVCSGIEAASVAWEPLGWTPVAFSEIEPFPSAVLAHRFPNVPNLGDMTKHAGWTLHEGAVDLLVGGTPCASFSVAGLRQGLSDPRGGLMLTYLEIAQRLRSRWLVWENVPGVLSSNGGRDFGSFLGALGELGYGWAYRVLDAQWIRTQRHPRAVPQRRRRVFVVGCLGDCTAAAAVLFESESVCRDSAPRKAQRQATAADASGCAGAGGTGLQPVVIDRAAFNQGRNAQYDPHISHSHTMDAIVARGPHAVAFTQHGVVAGSLTARHDSSPCADRGQNMVACPTLTAHNDPSPPAVAMRESGQGYWMEDAVAGTIDANMGMSGHANRPAVIKQPTMTVRRLTPRECERLQGFPDDWTLIPWRKKNAEDCPDGPRYRALGNSMAVNCMEWIGQRIAEIDK